MWLSLRLRLQLRLQLERDETRRYGIKYNELKYYLQWVEKVRREARRTVIDNPSFASQYIICTHGSVAIIITPHSQTTVPVQSLISMVVG
mmetsp:Transcript_5685/g.12415  ORF Transcript_5685/g.12415 Transcript_5685/m.12415 type:complete len:90 (+) Transcript_5685:2430-2699(+)